MPKEALVNRYNEWKDYIASLSEEHQKKLLASADIVLFNTNWDIEDKRLANILTVFVENVHNAIEEINFNLLGEVPVSVLSNNFKEDGLAFRESLLLMNTVQRETNSFPMGPRYFAEMQRALRKAARNAIQAAA
jgi:hypothetical protein